MWTGFLDWMESEPLKKDLIDKSDFKNIKIVQDVDEVITLLKPLIDNFYSDN
jgi:hypothetical protein